MTNWTIRRAEHRDADALSACFEAAYGDYAARIADLPAVSEDCAGEIARHQVWVAEFENAIVGGLVLCPETDFMLLSNVAVHPGLKGVGLGRALIALAEKEASGQGYSEIRLTTHVDMPESILFYGRLGWQEDQRQGNKASMKKAI